MTERKQKNVGLCLLRMLMCYEVILCHFWNKEIYSNGAAIFKTIRNYAVPVFILMSFYLTKDTFLSGNKGSYRKRLLRLIYPLLGWTLIYWMAFVMIEILWGIKEVYDNRDWIWQLFTGHSPQINPAMWYQSVLIWITLIFIMLFFLLSEKIVVWILGWLMVLSLFFQYSGLNYYLCGGLRYELKYPLGRICEIFPYAIVGFLLSYCGIYIKMKKYKIVLMTVSLFVIGGGVILKPQFISRRGFGYGGLFTLMIAVAFLTVAVYFPTDWLSVRKQELIYTTSKYTLGIYCMHNLIGKPVLRLLGEKMNPLGLGCVIYFVCYVICAAIYRIPLKFCRYLVD